jgi:hypothetical protein
MAGIAATVYGVSFYELIVQGIPTVVFSPYGERDARELFEIRRLGVALVAEDEFEATQMLNRLVRDTVLRKSLSRLARKVIHANRGERFAEEVRGIIETV